MTRDKIIKQLLDEGVFRVDLDQGLVFGRRFPTRPLGYVDKTGYLRTAGRFQGKQYGLLVHRIVAIAAYGAPGPGLDTSHLNHVKTDNRAENLAFVTHGENVRQSVEAGIHPKGEGVGRAKLTVDDVREIREIYTKGEVTQQDLAHEYGVSLRAIHSAITGETWQDAPGPISPTCRGTKGEHNPSAKLTADGVRQIRETYAKGEVSHRDLADQYGVRKGTIQMIVTGKTWKHVPGPLTRKS